MFDKINFEHRFNKIDLDKRLFEIDIVDVKKQEIVMNISIDLVKDAIYKKGSLERFPLVNEEKYMMTLKLIANYLLENNISDSSKYIHTPRSLLEIVCEAPYSLNYLIYIQNAFLNHTEKQSLSPKFPYVNISKWKLVKDELFIVRFKEVWEKVLHNIACNPNYDCNTVLKYDQALFKTLFQDSPDGEISYNESCLSFLTWWESYAGRISVEQCISRQLEEIYHELSKVIIQEKQLRISLIYDKYQLGEVQSLSWLAVLPLGDVFRYKKYIIPFLLKCCYFQE